MATLSTESRVHRILWRIAWLLGLATLWACALALGYSYESFSLKALVVVFLAIVGGGVLAMPYRWAIQLLFVYLGFEGMAKLLSGYNPVVHVGADLLVMALTARWFLTFLLARKDLPRERLPLIWLFGAHFTWFLIEFVNPFSLGLFPSLAATKIYVNMLLLFAYAYYLTRDAKDAHRFMVPWMVVATVQVITGLYQAWLGPMSVLHLSPLYAVQLKKYEGFSFRPFGTTNQPGAPAIFVYLAIPFCVYFMIRTRSWLLRLYLAALLPMMGLLMVFCQIRSAIIKGTVGTAAFLVLGMTQASNEARKKILIAVPIIAAVLVFGLPQLTGRWTNDENNYGEAVDRTLTILDYNKVSEARSGASDRILSYAIRVPLGAGLSRTGSAAGKFEDLISNDPWFPGGFFTDNFWAATIAEIGIPGSAILTLLVLTILARGFSQMRRMHDPDLAALAAVILCSLGMVVLGLWGSEGLLYNPESAYFWFFSGLLLKLPVIDQERFDAQYIHDALA
jgi:hypothetical protein